MQGAKAAPATPPLPRYYQVQTALETDIAEGRYQPGALLPSERALCERFRVSSITIRRALRELSDAGLIYRENGVGTFVANQTRRLRIGLLLEGFTEGTWRTHSQMVGALVGSVGQVIWESGGVFSLTHAVDHDELGGLVETLLDERSFDGLLLRTSDEPPAAVVATLSAAQLPYVLIKKRSPARAANCVVFDNFGSARVATRHLLGLGHRHIALICAESPARTYRDRYDGYAAALAEHGLSADPNLVRVGRSSTEEAGYEEASALLRRSDVPSAILAADDLMVQGVLRAARDCGRRIPDDISVIAFDEIDFAQRYEPPLTAVTPTDYDLGRESAHLLLALIRGTVQPPVEIVLDPVLTVRSSTRSPDGSGTTPP